MPKKLSSLCLIMILIPFLASPAAMAGRLVSIEPALTDVVPTAQFSLDVAVNGAVDSLMGYNITVAFDGSYLEIVNVEEGTLPPSLGGPTFFRWLNEGCSCDSVFVNGSILGKTVDGPGTLFRLTFRGVKPGSTDVVIRRSDLRNGLNQKLSHGRENAAVIIEPPIGAKGISWGSVKYLYQ